jgi:hypothetical protein
MTKRERTVAADQFEISIVQSAFLKQEMGKREKG